MKKNPTSNKYKWRKIKEGMKLPHPDVEVYLFPGHFNIPFDTAFISSQGEKDHWYINGVHQPLESYTHFTPAIYPELPKGCIY